jgi:hypothetical protein
VTRIVDAVLVTERVVRGKDEYPTPRREMAARRRELAAAGDEAAARAEAAGAPIEARPTSHEN